MYVRWNYLWVLSLPCFLADFFQKHNVAVMTVRELFEFITDPSITSENIDDYLSKVRLHGLVTE